MIFKPQKALHLYLEEEKQKPKFKGVEYYGFEKYDGWYGYLDIDGQIKSGSGRVIPSVSWLGKKLKENMKRKGILIFEILVRGVPEFHILNGILNRSVGDYHAKDAYIVVHDFIPIDQQDIIFCDRYIQCVEIVFELDMDEVQIAPFIFVSRDEGVWRSNVDTLWEREKEGLILKASHYPYMEGKRNFTLMKIKEEIDADLLVVGVEEGEGKYKGTLGSLIAENKDGVKISVSGMTDMERVAWWERPDYIIGKVIKVKAMKRLPDGNLREPRYKCVRYDKNPNQID